MKIDKIKRIIDYLEGDKVIWIVSFILMIFSLLAVYSASGSISLRTKGNTEYFMFKQMVILITGTFIMYLIHKIKYTYFSRIANLLLYISVLLIILTLFKGTSINDTRRWITIPYLNLTFQSSDVAKIGLVIYLAKALTIKSDKLNDFKELLFPIFLPIGIIVSMIMINNNSTAGITFMICLIMLIVAGLSYKVLYKFIGLTLGLGLGFILVVETFNLGSSRVNTLQNRIEAFLGTSEQQYDDAIKLQSAIALGSFLGQGPGNSFQKNELPNSYSDYIYSIIVEEYGLIGGVIILLLFTILLLRGLRIVMKAPTMYSSLLALGITLLLTLQAYVHIMVCTGLFPITGQPLPLVSMGGTSIWFTCISLGILLSVSRININANQNASNR